VLEFIQKDGLWDGIVLTTGNAGAIVSFITLFSLKILLLKKRGSTKQEGRLDMKQPRHVVTFIKASVLTAINVSLNTNLNL
jgi:hypothetical protein